MGIMRMEGLGFGWLLLANGKGSPAVP